MTVTVVVITCENLMDNTICNRSSCRLRLHLLIGISALGVDVCQVEFCNVKKWQFSLCSEHRHH